ncbi:MAG: transposase [Tepidiformaceae bacterium]
MTDPGRFPLAYFITFTCYGTRLHGDPRGTVTRRRNQPGTPVLGENDLWRRIEETRLDNASPYFGPRERGVVHRTTEEVCQYRGWQLHALNVRTNHVHLVATARCHPDKVMGDVKRWSTRRLAEAGLVDQGSKVWTTHGSTRFLWNRRDLRAACEYVMHRQGPDLPMA